jgi:glycosyltransferase involved in cell wall biosynthesis
VHILFLSNYFPPEVNAPATRLHEHARQWVADGHTVDVLTSVPNFPEGEVYEGYENRLTEEERDGIRVTRVPMYISPNEGVIQRVLSYLSFMLSACWYAGRLPTPDVLVATSPQFFAALAGYVVAWRKDVPFVLEIRDLWPESIVAVGAMSRNVIIRFLEWVERVLYRKAEHIVVVTDSFEEAIAEKDIARNKISVIKNGIETAWWDEPLDEERLAELQHEHALEGKFVASYIGTIGMAHRADILLEAARRCDDPDIVFMVVGTGAKKDELAARQAELELDNFRLVDKVPKEQVPYLLALTDTSVVHLRDDPLFETVIPSKIFEAMATGTPIVLGVRGESRRIVETAEAGLPIPPEDPDALAEAVRHLEEHPELHAEMAENAYRHVRAHYDRKGLAREYAALLERIAGKESVEVGEDPQLEHVG